MPKLGHRRRSKRHNPMGEPDNASLQQQQQNGDGCSFEEAILIDQQDFTQINIESAVKNVQLDQLHMLSISGKNRVYHEMMDHDVIAALQHVMATETSQAVAVLYNLCCNFEDSPSEQLIRDGFIGRLFALMAVDSISEPSQLRCLELVHCICSESVLSEDFMPALGGKLQELLKIATGTAKKELRVVALEILSIAIEFMDDFFEFDSAVDLIGEHLDLIARQDNGVHGTKVCVEYLMSCADINQQLKDHICFQLLKQLKQSDSDNVECLLVTVKQLLCCITEQECSDKDGDEKMQINQMGPLTIFLSSLLDGGLVDVLWLLCQKNLSQENSGTYDTDISLKVLALSTTSQLFATISESGQCNSFVEKCVAQILSDGLKLFNPSFDTVSRAFVAVSVMELCATLTRTCVELGMLHLVDTGDKVAFVSQWKHVFELSFCDSLLKNKTLQRLGEHLRCHLMSLMGLLANDSGLPATIATQISQFLVLYICGAITGHKQPGLKGVEQVPMVLAEALNTFIDLFGPDTYNELYTVALHKRLVPLVKPLNRMLKTIKPSVYNSAEVFETLMSQIEMDCQLEMSADCQWMLAEMFDVDMKMVKQRLAEMHLNLQRFVQYKNGCMNWQ